jgi:hypothetical protein
LSIKVDGFARMAGRQRLTVTHNMSNCVCPMLPAAACTGFSCRASPRKIIELQDA